MSATFTEHEVRQLRREVADLRRDVQRLKSDLMWKESHQQFKRETTLQAFIIVVSFAAMGGLLALITVLAAR